MNRFKRLLFPQNPSRLPPVKPTDAAIWNEDGVWKTDVGNGPEDLVALAPLILTAEPVNPANASVTITGELYEFDGVTLLPTPAVVPLDTPPNYWADSGTWVVSDNLDGSGRLEHYNGSSSSYFYFSTGSVLGGDAGGWTPDTGEVGTPVLTANFTTNFTAGIPGQVASFDDRLWQNFSDDPALPDWREITDLATVTTRPVVAVTSGGEQLPGTAFGKHHEFDGSCSQVGLPLGTSSDVGKSLTFATATALEVSGYNSGYWYPTEPEVIYSATAIAWDGSGLTWKVSLEQNNVKKTGGNTIGDAQTYTGQLEATGQTAATANSLMSKRLVQNAIAESNWVIDRMDGWTKTLTGSATLAETGHRPDVLCSTGATANSTIHWRSEASYSPWRYSKPGQLSSVLNWSVPMIVSSRCSGNGTTSANFLAYFFFGGLRTSTSYGAPTTKGVGIKLEGGTLYGIAHDGTTLTTTASIGSIGVSGDLIASFAIHCDGAGNATFYVNGVAVLTTTGAPTGTATSANDYSLSWSITNGATASAMVFNMSTVKILYP